MSYDKSGLDSYNDVASRISEFREKYPDGALQPLDPHKPFEILTVGDRMFVVYTAVAWRGSEDVKPGIAVAWEPFPGRTPYTKDSELQNAETSAWGRAIVAALAADTRKGGIASAEDIRNRQADRDGDDQDRQQREQARRKWLTNCAAAIEDATDKDTLDGIAKRITEATNRGPITMNDAVDMRRKLVAKLDALYPDANTATPVMEAAGVPQEVTG